MFRLVFLLLAMLPATGQANQDNYYSDDLFEAIAEARKRSHHYDYSQPQRYNRSTSQSINIPRMLNQELGQKYVMTPIEVDLQGNPSSHATSDSNFEPPATQSQTQQIGNNASNPVSVTVSVR